MYFTAAMLADQLAISPEQSIIMPENAGQYRSVRLLLPGQKQLDHEAVYVAEPGQLAMLEYVDPHCLIICTPGEHLPVNCSLLTSRDDLAGTFSAAVEKVENFEKFDSELKNHLLEGDGLDALLNTCARFFKNLVQVIDQAFNVIAGCSPITEGAGGEITGYEEDVSTFSASTLDEMSRSNLLQETYAFKGARFHKSSLFQYRAIITNLFQENHYLGKLLIIEKVTTLGSGAIDVTNQIVQYFSHLMQKRTTELNLTLHTAEYFISEIIKGNLNDVSFIGTQLASLDWRMNDAYVVLAIQIKSQILTEFYIQVISNHLDDAVSFPVNDSLVTVIRLEKASLDDVLPRIRKVLGEANLQGGISEVFNDFMTARDGFTQARSALGAAVRLESPGFLHRYQDQSINHLYLLAVQAEQQKAFIHPAIRAIVQYDQENNTEYFDTIKTYLSSSYNQVLTAKRLNIHRKTLQYRLTRLIKIAGIDPDDPDEQIRLRLSIRFYENELHSL